MNRFHQSWSEVRRAEGYNWNTVITFTLAGLFMLSIASLLFSGKI